MSRSPMYDPQTSEARSPWLAGLTDICNKLSGVLNMETQTFEDLTLPELFISEDDRFRIYQAPLGNKLWLQTPAPVIKKNGAVIDPNFDGFEIDYLGGSIAFLPKYTLKSTDIVTASATYVVDQSKTINTIISRLNDLTQKTGSYKGSYDNFASLNGDIPTGQSGDYAIVQDEDTIYVWNVEKSEWVNVYKETDLSNYFTKSQVEALVNQKEDSISAKGNTESSDMFYFGGRKTWVSLATQVLSVTLAGLVSQNAASIAETDSLLTAFGKLQAQINTFIHPLTGTSEPTTSLVGKIGQDYINVTNGDKYHLIRIDDADTEPKYIWDQYAPTAQLQARFDDKVSKLGDEMSGDLSVPKIILLNRSIEAAVEQDNRQVQIFKSYDEDRVVFAASNILPPILSQSTESLSESSRGIIDRNCNIGGVGNPILADDAANKEYVDTSIQVAIQSAIQDTWTASY